MIKSRQSFSLTLTWLYRHLAPPAVSCKVSGHQRAQHNFSAAQNEKRPTLTLYTKVECVLCDEALEQLGPLLDQVILEKVDITTPENKHWWKMYRYDIPVFHLNGKFLMKHKADISLFREALRTSSPTS